jgi:MarR family transcriptional regulator for hemolysin
MPSPLPSDRLGFDLSRLARRWRSRLDERLAPLGLTQAKWTILLHLSKAGGQLPQRDLADSVGVEGPTLVRVLDGLERLALIERREAAGDRRSKIVHLTGAATPLIEQIGEIAARLRDEVFAGFAPDELALCHRLLLRMAHNLDHARDQAGERE